MILKRLTLHNYRQHGDLTVDFEGHVIGLIGSNGRGKSHLLDSIQFCFTGKVPGQDKSKMLKWGESEGYAELEFSHLGHTGVIYREVHSTKATFKFKKKTHTGITKVNQKVAELTGMDADICSQAVFVAQKEIDSVLFTTPSVRQVAWQKLCGLADVNKIHERIGKFLSSNPPPDDVTELIVDASDRVDLHEETVSRLETELAVIEDKFEQNDLDGIKERLERFQRLTTQSAETLKLNRQVKEGTEELYRLQADYDAVIVPELPTEDPQALQTQIAQIQQSEGLERRINDAADAVLRCENQLKEVREIPQTEIQTYTSKLNELSDAISSANGLLDLNKRLQEALNNVDETSTCPMCSQDIADISQVLKHLQDTSAATEASIAELVKQRDEHNQKIDHVISNNRQFDELKRQLEQHRSLLTSLKSSRVKVPDASVADLQARLNAYNATAAARQSALTAQSTLAGKLESKRQHIESLTAQLSESVTATTSLMGELGVKSPGEISPSHDREKAAFTEVHQAQVELESMRTELRKEREFLDNTKETLQKLEKKQKDGFTHRAVNDTITRVREWFHYTNGPQQVIDSLLARITAGVNEFLDQFNSEFRVTADPGNMSFRYHYCDGRPMPEENPEVSELSGGEMIILAVSFRFATYCLFAGRVGLLSLDEPTVYLDKYNVSQFGSMIQKVKEIAARMDLQILISTHEESVMPQLDTVVQLGERTIEE